MPPVDEDETKRDAELNSPGDSPDGSPGEKTVADQTAANAEGGAPETNTPDAAAETGAEGSESPAPANPIPGFMVSWTSPEGEAEEGPMTLLWELIEAYQVDIFEVSLNKITDDFLDFMARSRELQIEHSSSFAVMASRLLFYKSKALLPDPGFEEQDADPRLPPELIQQLLEHRKFQFAAEKLRNLEDVSSGMLTRDTGLTPRHMEPGDDSMLEVSLVDLVRAYAGVLEKLKEAAPEKYEMNIAMEEFSVEEKSALIRSLLENAVSFAFDDLFEDIASMNRGEIIATFLAILEMTKLGEIVLKQNGAFAPIEIFKKSIVVR